MESITVSVLVNESPTEEFRPSRGLRQGDPLVPFLFIIVAEGLARLVRQAIKVNLLSGVKIGRKEVEVRFLQYADDTLFFCEESWRNVVIIKTILTGFELAGINVHNHNLISFSKILNCTQMGHPFKYLGLEVGGNPRKKVFWKPVLNKLNARLCVWKGMFLSLAGRCCVIKSVLTAIPLFYLLVFKAPESVYKNIISIQRKFLWGWGRENKPISWVSWVDLCKPKEEGGLGFKDIRKFNSALLAKWRWRFISQEKGKWKEVLDSKYGAELECPHIPVKYQSWWWRDIVKVCREGGGDGWFQEELRWKLGKGDKVRFWEDVWVGESNLKTSFQRLFSLSVNQDQKMEEVGEWEGTDWRWRVQWRRDRFEWEAEMEENLMECIERASLERETTDIQVWGVEAAEKFTVNSAYECLAKQTRGTQQASFELVWKAKAFPNVLTTTWRILIDRLPTKEGLSRRGVLMDTTVCVLCKIKEESCQHLFIDCKYAQLVWSLYLQWLGFEFVQHNDLKSHFVSFHCAQASSKQNLVWKGIWAAIVRSIWDQRNSIVFNQGVADADEIFQMAQLKVWLWLKYRSNALGYSFAYWILNPVLCINSIK